MTTIQILLRLQRLREKIQDLQSEVYNFQNKLEKDCIQYDIISKLGDCGIEFDEANRHLEQAIDMINSYGVKSF